MSGPAHDGYRSVGTVLKPHGVKGEFVLYMEADFPEFLARQPRFFAEIDGELVPWRVERARFKGDRLMLKVAELGDRDQAEGRRGTRLYLTEEEARAAVDDPDYYFNSDLVGLTMVEDESVFGRVRAVFEMPTQNLLEVEAEDGATFLFPFVDALIERVDVAGGFIHVRMPEGLVDCNR